MAQSAPSTLTTSLSAPGSAALLVGVAFSVLAHATILAVRFTMPTPPPRHAPNLEIVLVNARHATAPNDAKLLAQANLDGGGDSDQKARPTTLLPPQHSTREGDALVEASRPHATPQPREQQAAMTQANSTVTVVNPQPRPDTPNEEQPRSGVELLDSVAASVHLEAEIARMHQAIAERPRRRQISANTREHHHVQYLEEWRQKVERIGNQNYPESARGKLFGSLILTVSIKADGTLEKIVVNRSSGHKDLDDAAVSIVKRGERYAEFPPRIKAEMEIMDVTRTWTFTNQNQLFTH